MEKIKLKVGTAEEYLFVAKLETDKVVTYMVGYVGDLIVADRSKQNHVSKQIIECTQSQCHVIRLKYLHFRYQPTHALSLSLSLSHTHTHSSGQFHV